MHSLAIIEQGTEVHAEGDSIALHRGGHVIRRTAAAELDQLLLFGRVEVTSSAIALLLRRGVDVAWLTLNGRFRGRLVGRSTKHVSLRLAQYSRSQDNAFCLRFSSRVIAAKIHQQRQLLLRAQRKLRDPELAEVVGQLRLLKSRAESTESLDSLRGIEGAAAAAYFNQFGKLLRNPHFRFHGRSRRPPRDEVNSMLSFGYAVLGSTVETELYRCGIDPLLGFFHQPAYGRASLMLDLLEQWRPTLDALVLRVVNRRQLSPGDFEHRSNRELEEVLSDDSSQPASEAAATDPSDDDAIPPWEEPENWKRSHSNGDGHQGQSDGSKSANGNSEAANADPQSDLGVYLGDMARRVFLNEFFRRLRERMFYPPRQAAFELRDVFREQIYHLARVLEGEEDEYVPFVPE